MAPPLYSSHFCRLPEKPFNRMYIQPRPFTSHSSCLILYSTTAPTREPYNYVHIPCRHFSAPNDPRVGLEVDSGQRAVADDRAANVAELATERAKGLAEITAAQSSSLALVAQERAQGFLEIALARADMLVEVAAEREKGLSDVAKDRALSLAVVAEERASGLASVVADRAELDREIDAMYMHKESHEGYVMVNIGGHLFHTSVQTLRRIPNTFFDAYFSFTYDQVVCEDGSIFVDRDGQYFAYVLEFMRDGCMTMRYTGEYPQRGVLRALKREFDFYHIFPPVSVRDA
jgi:hypothetical protein